MQYLDDMIELVEDLPDEIQKRFHEIRRLDELVEEMNRECKLMMDEVFNKPETSKERRENLITELTEKRKIMQTITEKKLHIAERSERLMLKIYEKVQESAYHCKIELEVDNPGVSEQIEKKFCASLDLRPSSNRLLEGVMEFESIHEIGIGEESGSETLSLASEATSVASSSKFILKERTNKSSNRPKKYKKNKKGELSYYKKKKLKAMQEEVNARRLAEDNHFQAVATEKLNRVELATYEEDETIERVRVEKRESSVIGDDDEDMDALDVLGLFPNLPSPPKELLESLKEEMPFEISEHSPDSQLPAQRSSRSSSLSLSHFSRVSAAATAANYYADSNNEFSNALASPSLNGRLSTSQTGNALRKNIKKLSFGNANDTSFHGRIRKLTDKAVESMEFLERDKSAGIPGNGNKKKEEWCICRENIEDDMILCDNKRCPVKWYHMSCIKIEVVPEGEWFCSYCLNSNYP